MKAWEVVAISLTVTVVVFVGAEFTRAKGARVFNRGVNGEDTLVFDKASAPAKKA